MYHLKYLPILCLGLSLFYSCGGKIESTQKVEDTYPKNPPKYQIQIIGVGSPDSIHLEAAFDILEEYFTSTDISFSSDKISIADSMILAPDKISASQILSRMVPLKPDTIQSLIGITEVNIATEERVLSDGRKFKNWSILGLGSLQRGVCVISYARLPNIDHFSKTVVHEFGHTLGLKHCPQKYCIMVDGDGSSQPIKESTGFCDSCQIKVDHKILSLN